MRSLSAVVAIMFMIAAVCIAPLTDDIQGDYIKRYLWKTNSIDLPLYKLIDYEQHIVCSSGRVVEGIHAFVRIARMGCQEEDGNAFPPILM